MPVRQRRASLSLLAVAGATGALLSAQAATTTWSGVYTSAQASDGELVVLDRCAGCHQPDLSGGEDAPALAGAQFAAKWDGRGLGVLFSLIRRTMPMDAPGSLSAAESAAVIAHLLHQNGFPEGTAPLPLDAESLNAIRFSAHQP
ncbi:MAG: c-type cytochrome [Vicinamibacterales bacterium]